MVIQFFSHSSHFSSTQESLVARAIISDSTDTEHFHCCRKSYGTVLNWNISHIALSVLCIASFSGLLPRCNHCLILYLPFLLKQSFITSHIYVSLSNILFIFLGSKLYKEACSLLNLVFTFHIMELLEDVHYHACIIFHWMVIWIQLTHIYWTFTICRLFF